MRVWRRFTSVSLIGIASCESFVLGKARIGLLFRRVGLGAFLALGFDISTSHFARHPEALGFVYLRRPIPHIHCFCILIPATEYLCSFVHVPRKVAKEDKSFQLRHTDTLFQRRYAGDVN